VFVGDPFGKATQAQSPGRRILEPGAWPSAKGISLDELWSRRVKYRGGGGGTIGVDEAIMTTTCRLHCLGWRDARIIDDTLRRVRQVHAEQAAGEQWDWEQERVNIAWKLNRWKDRWSAIRKERAVRTRAVA
jgi:hypothetical protein